MLSCRRTSVKGFCKDFCPLFKKVKTNRKTQEICSFNLQTAGVLGKQKAALPGGDKAACRKHLFSLFVPGIRYHPRQIHQTQRHRNGGQKAQNIVFFTQQAGKRTGDDIAVGIVQKVEIGIQWFIQEVNRQGRAKQKSQQTSLIQYLSAYLLVFEKHLFALKLDFLR